MAEIRVEPSRVTVMIKPVGALCNLDCTYCYYLPTKGVFDNRERRMSIENLEEIFASILPRFADEVTIAWQGGEPTLAGLDFFRKAIEFQEKYRRPTQRINHALQTNGTLLDDEWCEFLRENKFLIGLSVDGPPKLHDHYRVTNKGKASSDQVLRGMKLLQKHAVDYNILTVLNDYNVKHPDEVYNYLMKLGVRWMQFIPAVEWEADPDRPGENKLAPFSPAPADYGRFLCRVFDQWFEKHRKHVSIRIFDAVMNKLVMGQMPFCILDGSCHNQLTIEHDGAVFGCDHFVERRWQLTKIGDPEWVNSIPLMEAGPVEGAAETVGLTVHGGQWMSGRETEVGRDIDSATDVAAKYEVSGDTIEDDGIDDAWMDRVDGVRLGTFAKRKQDLPEKCKACQWKPFCYGGCPKHRAHGGDVPEPTVLCEAYMMFYEHAMPRMQWLAGFIRQNQQPPDPQPQARQVASGGGSRQPSQAARANQGRGGTAVAAAPPKVKRNDPCPCGSGMKYKQCHGKKR